MGHREVQGDRRIDEEKQMDSPRPGRRAPMSVPSSPPTARVDEAVLPRRDFLRRSVLGAAGLLGGAGALGALAACAPGPAALARAPGFPRQRFCLSKDERELLSSGKGEAEIVTTSHPRRGVLRQLARPVPPGLDLTAAFARMERAMRRGGGVGIAGPQIGLSLRLVVLTLDYRTPHPASPLFVRNPVVLERSPERIAGYEGCLSIPGVGGLVYRNAWVRIGHTSPEGEPLVASAEGANAVLWQHEIDHLDGALYVDRLVGPLLPMDEVRRRRRELEETAPPRPTRSSGDRRGSSALARGDLAVPLL
jgi:peptide deformylase